MESLKLPILCVLHKLFDFEEHIFRDIKEENEVLVVSIDRTSETGICPCCGRKCSNLEEEYVRRIRDLDVSVRNCFVDFVEYKIRCSCGYRGVEKLNFVDKYVRYTKRFEEYVAHLCRVMSLKDVAAVVNIDWKTAKNIDKKHLENLVGDMKSVNPAKIGVDEIAYQKGHKYLTVVRDLDGGKVIWVGEGRKKETLDLFFKELGSIKSYSIRVVTMDMWDPYVASVKRNTCADIVFDKFHVAKKMNEALDSVRKQEFAKASSEERKTFKKKRFIILTREERLDEEKKEDLKELMSKNERLYEAYLLKEQSLSILDEKDEIKAQERFDRWFENVKNAGINQFVSVVKTIKTYWYGIENYFKYHLTNAGSEGFNNKINVIKRRAYGFRDLEYFKLKILQSCGWKT